MIAWWNGSSEAWESLLSFSTASPSPGVAGSPVLRLGEGGRGECSFAITFAVPNVPPGAYPIAVLQEVPGGGTLEASVTFHVEASS